MIEAAWIPFRLRSLHGPLCPDPHSYFQSICPIRIAVHAPGDPAGFRSVLLTAGYHEPVSVVCLSDLLHLGGYDQGLLSPLCGPSAPPGSVPGSPASYGQSPEGYIRPLSVHTGAMVPPFRVKKSRRPASAPCSSPPEASGQGAAKDSQHGCQPEKPLVCCKKKGHRLSKYQSPRCIQQRPVNFFLLPPCIQNFSQTPYLKGSCRGRPRPGSH